MTSSTATGRDTLGARPAPHRWSWAWLGVMPFFLFILFFLVYPSSTLVIGSFQDNAGHFTFANILGLSNPFILGAYEISLRISLYTAAGGAIFGFLLAYAAVRGGLPSFVRSSMMTFCGVASNFAGIPLAFAFIASVGRVGVVTELLNSIGINLYDMGFSLYSILGLSVVYMYFQFPLMVLIITPAIDGLRREWREAAENLGGSFFDYWRRVALPILTPSILGTAILLFGNAFGAYATAYALTGGVISLVTLRIGDQLSGDVGGMSAGAGYAMALGMLVIMTVCITGYTVLQRQSERWLK
ncbi:MAG: ABC transporter permease subunit [Anaerolineales bacterium]